GPRVLAPGRGERLREDDAGAHRAVGQGVRCPRETGLQPRLLPARPAHLTLRQVQGYHPPMEQFPRIISVDDHVVEPPDVWTDRLPSRYREVGPRVVRAPVGEISFVGGKFSPRVGNPGDGPDADWWFYEDLRRPLLCVKAYNDWMVEEWCGPSGGRLIPLTLIPLWDADLAASEVRRNAGRAVRAVCFSEIPPFLGLPSVHDPGGFWDPFFRACEETGTVICMHIGSSSKMPSTSADAPPAVGSTLTFANAASSLVDWLSSGGFT